MFSGVHTETSSKETFCCNLFQVDPYIYWTTTVYKFKRVLCMYQNFSIESDWMTSSLYQISTPGGWISKCICSTEISRNYLHAMYPTDQNDRSYLWKVSASKAMKRLMQMIVVKANHVATSKSDMIGSTSFIS